MTIKSDKGAAKGMTTRWKIKTPELCRMLGVSRQTLWDWERKGYFTPPRMGRRGDRAFTKKQASEIREAFSPGGSGKWHYKPIVKNI